MELDKDRQRFVDVDRSRFGKIDKDRCRQRQIQIGICRYVDRDQDR